MNTCHYSCLKSEIIFEDIANIAEWRAIAFFDRLLLCQRPGRRINTMIF